MSTRQISRVSNSMLRRVFATQAAPNEQTPVKDFNEVPTPRGYPVVGTLFDWMPRLEYSHVFMMERYKEYGPIIYEKIGNQKLVFIMDSQAVEECFRQETGHPERITVPVWNAARKDANEDFGILISWGEDWARMRRVIDKTMLKPKQVATYAKDFNIIAAEVCDRLRSIRGDDLVVDNLDVEMFNWALESVSCILYEKRMGCISDSRDPDTEKFINAVNTMFATTSELFSFPMFITRTIYRKKYKKHTDSWNTIFRVAKECIEENLEKLKHIKLEEGQEREVGMIEHLLAATTLTPKEVFANITELMAAGVDTTSNSVNFMLYELSQNQEIQQNVYDEIHQHAPDFNNITAKNLNGMHYLKACIKETMRLYPVVIASSRVFKKEITLLGYRIPAGLPILVPSYILGRLESNFENPLKFDPARWLRGDNNARGNTNPFAYLPFGFGARMCIGRRVAELEMQLLVCQMLHRFKLKPGDEKPLDVKNRLVLVPASPIRLQFIDRK